MMKKIIFIITFCLINLPAYANISIFVDKKVVAEGDSFTVSISGIKSHIVTLPTDVQDILEKDFKIVGMGRQHSFDSSTFSQTSTLSVILQPKKTGIFVIPPFKIEGNSSEPIKIEVTENPKHIQSPSGNGGIFIKAFVDNENPYIGEQVIYTVKVYDSIGSSDSIIDLPQDKSGEIDTERLDSVITGREVIDGVQFIVYTAMTAIFPLKTGEIEIPASKYIGVIIEDKGINSILGRKASMAMVLHGLQSVRNIAISSEPVKIKVEPKAYSDRPWLVAKRIAINDVLSPVKSFYREGETITRTITFKADGQIASNLPKIMMESDKDYNIYPGKVENSNNFSNAFGFTGELKQEFLVAPLQGKINIPKYEVTYFNTVTKKAETVSSKGHTLTVEKSFLKDNSVSLDVNKIEDEVEVEDRKKIALDSKKDLKETLIERVKGDPYIIGMLVIIALLFILLLKKSKRGGSQILSEKDDVKRTKSKQDTIAPSQTHNFRKDMKDAISYGNALSAKNVAVKWYNHEFNDKLTTIEAVAMKLNSDDFNKEVEKLNVALYSDKGGDWSSDNFISVFLNAIKKERTEDKKVPVPSLYPF